MNTVNQGYCDLLSAARAGSADAQGRLLERYRKYLTTLVRLQLYRRLQVKLDASDVVQETYLQAYRHFDQFEGDTEQALLGWLRAILSSRISKVVRHHVAQKRDVRLERRLQNELNQSSAAIDQALMQSTVSPSKIVAGEEQSVRLANAIEDLPEDYRAVILLHHIQALPHKEVATIMNRTTDSVKKLWVRALAQLHRVMEGNK